MIELIKTLIPVAAVVVTWFLGRRGVSADIKKQDAKNLKRLLYQLLELRSQIEKMLGVQKQVQKLTERFLTHPKTLELGSPQELAALQPLLMSLMTQAVIESIDTTATEGRIEPIVADLAEIDPVFAYELTGRYKISEKMMQIRSWLDKAPAPGSPADETAMSLITEDILRPALMDTLLIQLNEHLQEIANKIDRTTRREVDQLLRSREGEDDEAEMDRIIERVMQGVLALKDRMNA